MPKNFEQETREKLKEAMSKAQPRDNVFPLFKTQSIVGDGNQQINNQPGGSQSIKGDHNIQITGDINLNTSRSLKFEVPLPANSIGTNSDLTTRIKSLINEIKDERYKRYGNDNNWKAFYGNLSTHFGFPKNSWTLIFTLDESHASSVIGFLRSKLDNTIGGRIKKAAARSGYMHTKGQCFKHEKNYLEQLEWDDAVAKVERENFTGYTSRKDIPVAIFNQWVAYLGRKCDAMYGDD